MRGAGEFCWMDIKTPDLDTTGRELGAALDWECLPDPDDHRDAATARKARFSGHWVAGLSALDGEVHPDGTPPHVSYYLQVHDTRETHRRAVAAGAASVVPPSSIADLGELATVVDPFGAAVSFWQPGRFAGWSHPPGSPGTPGRMLHTSTTPSAAARFYREHLGVALSWATFRAKGAGPPGWTTVIRMSERAPTALTPVRLPSGHAFLFA